MKHTFEIDLNETIRGKNQEDKMNLAKTIILNMDYLNESNSNQCMIDLLEDYKDENLKFDCDKNIDNAFRILIEYFKLGL